MNENDPLVVYSNHKSDLVSSSSSSMDLVTNGSVDYRGRIADKRKTGGWKASPFIIANEAAERLTAFTVSASMMLYLTKEMRESVPDAATHVSDWVGVTYLLMLVGAFIADAYLGRFLTVILSSAVYLVGMVMLTVSASVDSLRPPKCPESSTNCPSATPGQSAFLYSALALVALGTGGVKPNVPSFGADQHDENDEKELAYKYSFFNWFFLSIKIGALIGLTIMVYIEQELGYAWGFGLPTVIMFCSAVILAAGFPKYRYKKPMGSIFTRFIQVAVVAVRNHFRRVEVNEAKLYEVDTEESDILGVSKLSHTSQCRFLDKAAVIEDHEASETKNRWKVCTVTQVEELKTFIRVLPVWASTIALSLSLAQQSTFFLSQSKTMDRKIGPHFEIPPGSMQVFAVINAFITVPLYEKYIVPALQRRTGHHRGLTSLRRMGVGLFISIFALAAASLVEHMRRTHPNPSKLSVFWLVPQYFILGGAESFTYVGQLEFFYDEATDGMKSVCGALFLSEIGIGSWANTALVNIVEAATGRGENGWLQDDLNKGKLDYYYAILATISLFNLFIYVWLARRYKGRSTRD